LSRIKKVVVIGPESTGKSTLSAALAKELGTVWVPEYARVYLETLPRPYEEADLKIMAGGQLGSEDELAGTAGKVLICDTDLQVIKVWSEHKYDRCDNWILEQIAQREYDLYLLTYIDVNWEADPLREHADMHMRQYFYNVYHDIVENSGIPWADVRGNEEERLQLALTAIKKIL
jgi:NadR type nicotinamide-nucleotide adenylyltransferase